MARAAGYYRVADLFASQPSVGLFRRFQAPNALVLLHMQAEIVQLCEELQAQVSFDRTSQDAGRRELECHFSALRYRDFGEQNSIQHQKLLDLRVKLQDYYQLLLTARKVCKLPKVDSNVFDNLQAWLSRFDGGNNFLHGFEARTWHPDTMHDLMSLCSEHSDRDMISRLVDGNFIPWLDKTFLLRTKTNMKVFDSYARKIEEEPMHYFSDSRVSAILSTLATTIAFVLVTLPIFALYRVASPMGRTGVVVAFTFVFSVTISMMTKARRIEYFAATVGFCAVLAAIIGNNNDIQCHS